MFGDNKVYLTERIRDLLGKVGITPADVTNLYRRELGYVTYYRYIQLVSAYAELVNVPESTVFTQAPEPIAPYLDSILRETVLCPSTGAMWRFIRLADRFGLGAESDGFECFMEPADVTDVVIETIERLADKAASVLNDTGDGNELAHDIIMLRCYCSDRYRPTLW